MTNFNLKLINQSFQIKINYDIIIYDIIIYDIIIYNIVFGRSQSHIILCYDSDQDGRMLNVGICLAF